MKFQTLIVSLVLSRLDYRNAVLVGLPAYLLHRLQWMINAAAWLIFDLRRTNHISDALITLHWLHAMYKSSHGAVLLYLSQLVRVADLPGLLCLHSAWTNHLLVLSMKLSTVGGQVFPVTGTTV